jgi:leucyl-tRNA synthetase
MKSHETLAGVSDDFEKLKFNTAIAKIYGFVNDLQEIIEDANRDFATEAVYAAATREALEFLVQMIAPTMPHLAEECWAALGHQSLISTRPWPAVEESLTVRNTVTLPVQINGKKRADVTVARDAGESDITLAVLQLEAVRRALDGKKPKKVIVVPQRIVNVVA